MPRKLPPYFLHADPDSPCDKCDKIKKTCKFCESCYDCCECSPYLICCYCHGYHIGVVQGGSDMAKALHECQCEPCPGCGKNMPDRDLGNYMPDDCRPWCDVCYHK